MNDSTATSRCRRGRPAWRRIRRSRELTGRRRAVGGGGRRGSSASTTFPLVEPGAVTFVWRGEADAGGAAALHPRRRRPAAVRAAARHRPLAAAAAGRERGAVRVQAGGRRGREARTGSLDPLNPARAEDPFGQNSVCHTFGYARPAWSEPRGAPAGRIEELGVASAAFGETRERAGLSAGRLRSGAGVSAGGRPRRRRLPRLCRSRRSSLDNLIAAGELPPLVAALVQTRDRMGEYSGGRRHARYLARELLPELEARSASSRRPRQRVLLGASLGAVASLATAFRYPGVFGGLVLKSGSFIFDERKLARRPHPVFYRIARLVRALRRAPGAARDAGVRLDRRARGAGRREPRARKLLARTRRRCFVQERVGRPPLAQLARSAPRRADLGAAARGEDGRLTGLRARAPVARGEPMARAHRQHRAVARGRHLLADRLREPARGAGARLRARRATGCGSTASG